MSSPWTQAWIASKFERRASFSVGKSDGLARVSAIDQRLLDQLGKVNPSNDGGFKYYPCGVRLQSGDWLERVYVQEARAYIIQWGSWPWERRGEDRSVSIDEVLEIRKSTARLPVHLANKMYEAGESGMGYCAFTVVLQTGERIAYVTGNAVDFLDLPSGVEPRDIVDLIPHVGREDPSARHWAPARVSLYRTVNLVTQD